MIKYGHIYTGTAEDRWDRLIVGDTAEVKSIYKSIWRNGIKNGMIPEWPEAAKFSAKKPIYGIWVARMPYHHAKYGVINSDTVALGLINGWIKLD